MKLGYYEGSDKRNNVCSFIFEHAKKNPSRPILFWCSPEEIISWHKNPSFEIEHSKISNAEICQLVQNTAVGLKELGIKKGDRVIIFISMSLPMYTAMFACQLSSAT